MKQISFCLYGNEPIYTQGIMENLPLCKRWYPGWQVVVYCDDVAYGIMGDAILQHWAIPTLWTKGHPAYARLDAINTNREGITIFRDGDSRITQREVAAVQQWIATGKKLHVMCDHEFHISKIMAGMFGLNNHDLPPINLEIPEYSYGDDEKLLEQEVWLDLQHDCLIHGLDRPGGIAFPMSPEPGTFIGQKVFPTIPQT